MGRRVAVLMGGWSAEREVSLVSGAACCRALEEAGHTVLPIRVERNPAALLAALEPRPDVVFNALHGRWGEDGCVQGLLEILGIPYTHSGVMASALAMNKPMAKRLFAEAGIPVAPHVIARAGDLLEAADPMPRPFVIKPLNEGSSVGVRIVRDGDPIPSAADMPDMAVMVERFIPGRELTVAVMGDRPLGVTEITTARGFYDYDAKYAPGGSRHMVPADVPDAVYAETLQLAVAAHRSLGCRGVSRADLRWDGETLFMLEVNTQPGMTPTSLVPEQAAHAGISFPTLVDWMVETAACDS
ncbi:MAG: D-alanine--D-alanine ligase [Rhodospirillales bacterium]|nr:MAG: D-alanine--D-alanine ligase [Rhodospirillales bacterium]